LQAPPNPSPPTLRERALWTVGVSVLWLIVYLGCNWITSHRTDVRTFQFAWERHLPLIPWMIVPYMSIDLFFLAGPWVCSTRRELQILCTRLMAATLIAGFCFLFVPLTLAGERPHFAGWPGAIYDSLKTGDKPYNLCPSLHVAILLILWPVYHRATHGAVRALAHIWFSLILFSVLPVYQHHFIDVAGGALLALLCFAAFPMADGWPDTPRGERRGGRIAIRYVAAALPLLALAIWLGPFHGWGVLAAWVGLVLALVAHAYLFGGPGAFRKSGGRIPPGTHLLFGPYLLGLDVSRRYWFGRMPRPWDRVSPSLIIGRRLRAHETASLQAERIVAVIDLTAEHDATASFREQPYLNLPVLDLTVPSRTQCRRAIEFIQAHSSRGTVYIHCGLGYSRSAVIAAAWLLASSEAATIEDACAAVARARPGVKLGPSEIAALRITLGSEPCGHAIRGEHIPTHRRT